MRELASFWLFSLSAIFFVVDPFGAAPIFLALTVGDSPEKKRAMALRAAVATAAILATFAIAGGVIFKLFGITLPAFKVAGGILLLLTSLDMLRAQNPRTRTSPAEEAEGAGKSDVALVPLAMPVLAGPGAIATAMVLMGRSRAWWQALPVLVSIALTAAASYLVLRAAAHIERALGVTGMSVLHRVVGLLLAALAAQFVLDGVREAFPGL